MSDTVLVTGAGGCIGAWTLKQLADEGRNAVAYDLSDDTRRAGLLLPAERLGRIPWETGDIADSERLAQVVEKHGIGAIIHLAALQVPFCKADPIKGAQVNVVGTVNVFEAARRAGISRLTYASSVAAHGVGNGGHWLATLYGAYKLCDEHLALVYWRDWQVPSVGIRPNVVYGPARDQGMSSLPTLAMLAAVLQRPFEIPFTGKVGFLYAREAAAAFVQAVADSREGAPVFDLNGSASSVERMVEMIGEHRPGAKVTCKGEPLPFPGDLADAALSEHIGAFRRWSLEDGLRETMDMFESLAQSGKLGVADLDV